MVTQAIVLAAGCGRRLMPHTKHTPKPLVRVASQPILPRLISQFADAGVTSFVLVVGDKREQIEAALLPLQEVLGVAFHWVENLDYQTTNNSYSLWLAREFLVRPTYLLEADVVADDDVIQTLSEAPEGCFWFVRKFHKGMDGAFLQGEAGQALRHLRIIRGEAALPGEGFKSMGMLKLSASFASSFVDWLEAEVNSGERDRYYDLVLADRVGESAPHLWPLEEGAWMEIDTPEDLEQARSLFVSSRHYPALSS